MLPTLYRPRTGTAFRNIALRILLQLSTVNLNERLLCRLTDQQMNHEGLLRRLVLLQVHQILMQTQMSFSVMADQATPGRGCVCPKTHCAGLKPPRLMVTFLVREASAHSAEIASIPLSCRLCMAFFMMAFRRPPCRSPVPNWWGACAPTCLISTPCAGSRPRTRPLL